MSIFDKHIDLHQFLGVKVLSTRATARELMEQIKTLKFTVYFDFSGIEFASRSFMDELNSLIDESTWTAYKFAGMNEQVRRMNELVSDKDTREYLNSNKSKKSDQSEMVSI